MIKLKLESLRFLLHNHPIDCKNEKRGRQTIQDVSKGWAKSFQQLSKSSRLFCLDISISGYHTTTRTKIYFVLFTFCHLQCYVKYFTIEKSSGCVSFLPLPFPACSPHLPEQSVSSWNHHDGSGEHGEYYVDF